ncbi:hypothetical protein FACS1894208_09340 [Clostridia bacterium]|nr:hypothetical protein FACS1894208_09340 [Clostridia bacterium]
MIKLELPKSTVFGRIIPKDRFYKNATERDLFTKQVERIRWANKIAPDTVNIAKGATVAEIEVIELTLNVPPTELDKRILPLISKAIPYKLLFVLTQGGKTAYALYFDDKNFYTTSVPPKLLGNDTDSVWENLTRQVAGIDLTDMRPLTEIIALNEQRTKLEREIAALANKIQREKQLNRQLELNGELKRLKAELEGLG